MSIDGGFHLMLKNDFIRLLPLVTKNGCISHIIINLEPFFAWRKKAGLSYKHLATHLGVSARTLSRWFEERRMPFAQFRVLQVLMLLSDFDANSIFKSAIYSGTSLPKSSDSSGQI
jgi:predicted transcriptional regulator